MATPKPQPSRALQVIPSGLCDIPNPALFITDGTITQINEANIITIDVPLGSLKKYGIKSGDIIYVPGLGAATITSVIDDGLLSINVPNDPMSPPETVSAPCQIYGGQDDNQGCVLYVGTGGTVETVTAGGDQAIYYNVPNGQIIPVQTKSVTKVIGMDPNEVNIIALW